MTAKKKAAPKSDGELVMISIRVPQGLLARVDKIAEELSEPGLTITRGEALRRTVYVGTEALEKTGKKKS